MAGARLPVPDLASLKRDIEKALGSTDDASRVLAVCRACAAALPGDGAAITVMTSDSKRETVFARNLVIAELENVQYNLGEGPSLLAFSTGRPVLVPDVADPSAVTRWPGFLAGLDGQPVRGIFSFPMRFGVISVGVCAFYRHVAGPLNPTDLAFVLDAVDLTTLALLELRDGQVGESLLGRWLAVDGNKRRQVHQATGMLIVQLGVNAGSAFARLRAHAFATDTDIDQVAARIVARRLRLEADPQPGLAPDPTGG